MNPYHKQLPVIQHPEEKVLHPTHFHNGIQICHEHKRGKVIFQAFDMDTPVNKRTIEMDTKDIIQNFQTFQDFYKSMKEIPWLCEKVR